MYGSDVGETFQHMERRLYESTRRGLAKSRRTRTDPNSTLYTKYRIERHIAGRANNMIIALDEVDYIRAVGGSDQFFSFIQSIFLQEQQRRNEFGLVLLISSLVHPARFIENNFGSPFHGGHHLMLLNLNSKGAILAGSGA